MADQQVDWTQYNEADWFERARNEGRVSVAVYCCGKMVESVCPNCGYVEVIEDASRALGIDMRRVVQAGLARPSTNEAMLAHSRRVD